jgi:uncharacterized protein YndB with AHSA1/START domain
MRAYEATSLINAEPERVWAILTDAPAWPSWDSGVAKVDGRVALGETVTVTIDADTGRAFPVKVVQLDAPERMVFLGGMPFGLFRGRRTYTLVTEAAGTRFTMREEYSGLLAGLVFKSIPDLDPTFRRFAEGLKQRAE